MRLADVDAAAAVDGAAATAAHLRAAEATRRAVWSSTPAAPAVRRWAVVAALSVGACVRIPDRDLRLVDAGSAPDVARAASASSVTDAAEMADSAVMTDAASARDGGSSLADADTSADAARAPETPPGALPRSRRGRSR